MVVVVVLVVVVDDVVVVGSATTTVVAAAAEREEDADDHDQRDKDSTGSQEAALVELHLELPEGVDSFAQRWLHGIGDALRPNQPQVSGRGPVGHAIRCRSLLERRGERRGVASQLYSVDVDSGETTIVENPVAHARGEGAVERRDRRRAAVAAWMPEPNCTSSRATTASSSRRSSWRSAPVVTTRRVSAALPATAASGARDSTR